MDFFLSEIFTIVVYPCDIFLGRIEIEVFSVKGTKEIDIKDNSGLLVSF